MVGYSNCKSPNSGEHELNFQAKLLQPPSLTVANVEDITPPKIFLPLEPNQRTTY